MTTHFCQRFPCPECTASAYWSVQAHRDEALSTAEMYLPLAMEAWKLAQEDERPADPRPPDIPRRPDQ